MVSELKKYLNKL